MSPTTKFSGWSVLFGCFVIMFLVQGSIQCFAIFLPSIMRDTGFTLGSVALMSSLSTVAAFVANIVFGPMLKKVGVKGILLIGTLSCAFHFVILSYSTSLPGLYVGATIAGIGIGFGTVAPVSVVVTNWFVAKRATYMSIVIAGSMFGGAVLMPMAGQIIQHFDWRMAYRILALIVGAIGVATICFVITDSPQRKGQMPFGADGEDQTDKGGRDKAEGVSATEARSSLSFWLLLVGVFLIGCSTNIENFLPAFWQSHGVSVDTSSTLMGIYALITGICTIFLGRIADRLGGKTYALLTSGLFIFGTIGIFFMGATAMPLMILVLIPFAAGAKKTSTLTPPLVVAESFGRMHYSVIIGNFTAVLQLGIAMSNPLIGALHRSSGGYQVPFMAMACLNVVALILVFTALRCAPCAANKHDKARPEPRGVNASRPPRQNKSDPQQVRITPLAGQ